MEIESELREMQGEDPNSSIDAAIASGDDDTEYYSTTNSIVNEQSSSSLESAKPTGFDEETNPSMAPCKLFKHNICIMFLSNIFNFKLLCSHMF